MKRLNTIYLLLAFLVLLGACREDDLLTLNSSVASKLDPLPVSEIVLSQPAGGENPVVLSVTWSDTHFYLSGSSNPTPAAPVTYELQMDKKENNFSTPEILASTTALYANILTKDLNGVLLTKFKATDKETLEMQLRIVAYYGENKSQSLISQNTHDFVVTAYRPLDVTPAVYLLGDMNGWNNTSTEFLLYRDSNSLSDYTYTYTGRLAANSYFKFLPEESLGTYKAYGFGGDGKLVYEESEGGAFYNEVERYVKITIDIKELTYSIEDFDASDARVYSTIGPIGGFSNWDNEPAMKKSTYDPHQWSGTFTFSSSTAIKFRAEHDWANNWGGGDSDFPYGKAVFDGPGVNLSMPGTYKIYFNDLTGHYAILQQ